MIVFHVKDTIQSHLKGLECVLTLQALKGSHIFWNVPLEHILKVAHAQLYPVHIWLQVD